MKYDELIRRERSNMSKSFGKLADFLLDSYIEAAFMTASELAQTLNLDAATVVRFSQYLGYSGFPKLQDEIRDRVKADLLRRSSDLLPSETTQGIIDTTMKELALALDHTRISLDINSIDKLVEKIGQARRIIILAEGAAQPNAYSLVQYLEEGGFPVYIARSGIADLARTVNTASSNDLLIGLEVAGNSPFINRALFEAQQKGIVTVSVIGTASFPSARCADIVISAQAHSSMGIGIVSLEAIIYTLAQLLRHRYADRFSGTELAIEQISSRIRQPIE